MTRIKEINHLAAISIHNGSTDPIMKEIYSLSLPIPVISKTSVTKDHIEKLRKLLPGYFASHPVGERPNEKDGLLIGNSWIDYETGKHYFRLKYLIKYLRTKNWLINKYALMILIKELGGGSKHMTIGVQGIQTAWVNDEYT